MKRLWLCACALALLTVQAGPVWAGWNNVFQTTLNEKNPVQPTFTTASYMQPVPAVQTFSNSATLCCDCKTPCPCPQQQCTTNYQQRCYYEPVTTYQSQSYYEPVTTYQTSYYYEPVTSYSCSMYYDPCTCSYQQVSTPVTSYQMRAQVTPVQSWVQRCASVPVTTYRKSCYLEPQNNCNQPVPAVGTMPPAASGQSPYPPAAQPQQAQPYGQPSSNRVYYNPQYSSPPASSPYPASQVNRPAATAYGNVVMFR